MRIQELIDRLEDLKAEHGPEIEVRTWENPVSTQPIAAVYYMEESPWVDTEAILIST